MNLIRKVIYVSIILCLSLTITSFPVKAATFDCGAVTDVTQDECEALVALYNSTNGDAWTNHTNWLTGTSVGSWNGVTVVSGHVTKLELYLNNLVGPIPPQIENLQWLTNLYLSNNKLTGTIPVEIANISTLIYLLVSTNELTGPIPSAIFTLPAVQVIQLHLNHLSGSIPSNIGDATTLTSFNAEYNSLSGPLPASLGDLTNLLHLHLEYNDLFGPIPTDIKNLSSSIALTINNSGFWSTDSEVQDFLTSRQSGWQNYQSAQGLNPLEEGTVGWGELTDNANFKPKFQFSKFFISNSEVAAEKYRVLIFSEGEGKYYLDKELISSAVCPSDGVTFASICEYIPAWSDFLFNIVPGEYYWKVLTWGGTDWIERDNIRYFTIAAPPVGTLPNDIVSKRNPKFTWSAVASAVQYNLVVMDAGHEDLYLDTSIAASSCTDTQCSFTPSSLNLLPGYYSWKVRAVFSGGDYTAFSDFIDFTTVSPPAPKFPATSLTKANPTFIWNKVESQTQYRIVLKNAANTVLMDKTITTPSCGATTCSYVPSPALTLANATGYKWQVKSFNGVWGDYSTMKTFNKVDPPAPQTPTGSITQVNPKFTWKKIPGATKYYIVLQKSSGTLVRNMEITTLNCTTTTCSYTPSPVLNLLKGDYKWKVKAFNGFFGDYSAFMTFKKK